MWRARLDPRRKPPPRGTMPMSTGAAARRVTGPAVEHVAQAPARIALQLRLGDAGLLEIELIELSIRGARHDAGWGHLAARPERHAEADNRAEAVGPQERRMPGNVAPQSWPTMTAVGACSASRRPTMSPTRWKIVYWSMASGRRSCRSRACPAQRRGSRPRRARRAGGARSTRTRESRGKQHEGPLALLGDVEFDAVGLDHALGWLVMVFAFCCGFWRARSAYDGNTNRKASGNTDVIRKLRVLVRLHFPEPSGPPWPSSFSILTGIGTSQHPA